MNKFLVSIILFATFMGILIITPYTIMKLFIESKDSFYEVEGDLNTIILGNSQIECSLNDSIIEKSISIASSADSYFHSFIKLRKFIEFNKQLNTVVLGFSNKYILKSQDTWFNGEKNIPYKFSQYALLMNLNEIKMFLYEKPISVIKGFTLIPRSNFRILNYNSSNFKNLRIGRFLYLQRDKLKTDIAIKRSDRKIQNFSSETEKKYLKKIEKFCSENGLNLILINPPIHKEIVKIESLLSYNDSKESSLFLKNNFKNIEYYDLSHFEIPDSCFADATHLNYKGAKILSKELNKILN